MTLELRKLSNPVRQGGFARHVRLAFGLMVLTVPLSGCGGGALWDKFFAKEETFVDEPADKLYNEGFYLIKKKKNKRR
jgi:outer membrane protein assembly factor BamD